MKFLKLAILFIMSPNLDILSCLKIPCYCVLFSFTGVRLIPLIHSSYLWNCHYAFLYFTCDMVQKHVTLIETMYFRRWKNFILVFVTCALKCVRLCIRTYVLYDTVMVRISVHILTPLVHLRSFVVVFTYCFPQVVCCLPHL